MADPFSSGVGSSQKGWLRKVSDSLYDSLRLSPKMGTWLLAMGRKGASVLGPGGPVDQFGMKVGSKLWEKSPAIFFGGAAVAQGTLRAASPDLFDTFTGSIQLLAAQLGQTLIPMFVRLSTKIQGWADDVSKWDDQTKKWVGTAAEVGLKLAAVGAALRIGNSLALGVPGALAARYPRGAAAVGGLAAAGFGAYEMWQAAKRDMAEDHARIFGNVTQEEVKDLFGGKTPTEAEAWEKSKEISRKQRGISLSPWQTGPFNTLSKTREFNDLTRQGEVIRRFLESQQPGGKPLDVAGKMGFVSNLAMAFRTARTEPKFTGIEDFWRNLQMEVLSKDPIEQKLEQIQQESLIKILEWQEKTYGMHEEVKAAIDALRR